MNNPLAGTDPTGYMGKCDQNPTCQMQSFFSSVGSGGSSLIGNLTGRLKTTLSNGHDTKQAKKAQEPKAAEVKSPAVVSFVLPSKDSVDRTHLANCGRIQQCSGLGNLIRNKLIPSVIGPGNSQNNSGNLSDNGNPPGVNEAYGSELSGVSTPSPGGLPPDEGDKENIRNPSSNEIKPFKNTISEQTYNTPPLRRLIQNNGKWKTVDGAGNMFTARGEYEFVTLNGRTYVGRAGTGHYNVSHGSEAVDFAGHIRFSHGSNRGVLKSWNNNSGHYKPTADKAWQAKLPLDKFTRGPLK